MPIRPENRARYPRDWPAISWTIRWVRALGRCECRGQCGRTAHHLDATGRCVNVNGGPAIGTGSTVVLTVAHLDHVPEHVDPANLRAMCNGCHLRYDRDHHAQTRRATLARARVDRGEHPLPLMTESALPDVAGNVFPQTVDSTGGVGDTRSMTDTTAKATTGTRFTLNGRPHLITTAGRVNVRYRTTDTTDDLHQYHLTTQTVYAAVVNAGLITVTEQS